MIRSTEDGGDNWLIQSSNVNGILSSVFFINELRGWVCGTNGTILKTTDGGSSWISINTNTSSWLRSIKFFDENNGIAVGSPGIILTSSDGGDSWEENISPSSYNLNSISITGNAAGWIVGDNGLIIKTSDMGLLWGFQTKGFQKEINDILFFNENEGIAVGNDGLIITTTNGGLEWVKRESGTARNINAVDYYTQKPNEIWAAGDSATILFSSDGGTTWTVESVPHLTIENLYSIEIGSYYAAAAGSRGAFVFNIFRTNTGWKRNNAPTFSTLTDVHAFNATLYLVAGGDATLLFFGKYALTGWAWGTNFTLDIFDINDFHIIGFNRGWAVGKYGFIIYSSSTFTSRWNVINQLDVNALNSVHFLNLNTGYTVGTNGSAFKTTDGGFNWQPVNTGITNLLKRVLFVNENTGWILGNNGVLLKTSNGGGISTEADSEIILSPGSYYLSQNFPNPFNPATTIEFIIPEASFIKLKVYDILGKEVAVLIDKEINAGKFSVVFDGTALPSGTYFYQLTAGDFSETKKLLLVK